MGGAPVLAQRTSLPADCVQPGPAVSGAPASAITQVSVGASKLTWTVLLSVPASRSVIAPASTDTVAADAAAGSASVMVAAIRLGRMCIGSIERGSRPDPVNEM